VDQSGDSYYYQLLRQAQGTGKLRLDVDIQLMAHTLYCIANSAGERLISPRPTPLRCKRSWLNKVRSWSPLI
jgi:hypothetical protein